MNEDPPAIQRLTGSTTALTSRRLTVNEAADAIGVDSFTMLSFIQRGKVNPTRSPSGEVMVPESEVTKLTERGR
jgi:predicted site-specific integrase-resolvase